METRLGIDVGGTFTDVVVTREDGSIVVEKVPSTPHNASVGILNGIRQIQQTRNVDPVDIDIFAHGSTVATNALLESKLPRTALVVTRGFADVLEIGTQVRPLLFNLRSPKPAPYVPRDRVIEVDERVGRTGDVVTALDDEEIERVIAAVRALDIEACAVTLLFSFRNPNHEEKIAARLRNALPGVAVAVSSAVAPELKEYPRASTTAASAALQPLVARYMAGIVAGLDEIGMTAPLYVMQSNGGVMTAEEAALNAHRMVLSGPAAGVLAATRVAQRENYRNQITFDMGGTSTDIALIHEGRAQLERETLFEGRPMLVPQFDIHTIGSGGGSLASVDEAGLLRVGPESAGAQPGPASYGRGGTRPTTTDAQVVLGRIDLDRFLGGEMALDLHAAKEAIRTQVADKLGISIEEAALGILEVADSTMAKGVRVVSVNKGFDPRDFLLLPFGGAGPMHALNVASLVGVGGVLVPSNPGTFSALGLAEADLKYDFSKVLDMDTDQISAERLEEEFAPLIQDAERRLSTSSPDEITHLRIGRFRYAWQDNDVDIILGSDPLTPQALEAGIDSFHRQHEFEFGHSDPDERVELVAVSLESSGKLSSPEVGNIEEPSATQVHPRRYRPVYFKETGWNETPVYDREQLPLGGTFRGPAVVEERESTTVVPSKVQCRIDGEGNMLMTFEGDA